MYAWITFIRKECHSMIAAGVGEADWSFKTSFAVDEKQLAAPNADLVFDGLDTFATVLLVGAAHIIEAFVAHSHRCFKNGTKILEYVHTLSRLLQAILVLNHLLIDSTRWRRAMPSRLISPRRLASVPSPTSSLVC